MNTKISWKKTMLAGLALVTAFALTACGSEPVVEEDRGVAVEAAEVQIGTIVETTVLKGSLVASEEVYVVPQAQGYVTAVNVSVGSSVRAGDVICVIDSSAYQANLLQAQAAYDSALLAYNNAVLNRDRMQTLYAEGAVSLQQLEQAELAVVGSGRESAEAALQNVQTQIDNCTVRSPINGTIASIDVQIGTMAGSAAVARVVSDGDLKMTSNITESNINRVGIGNRVNVLVKSVGEETFSGVIRAIAPAADPTTLTYPVEVTVTNRDGLLKPGMFGEAIIATETASEILLVPKAAVSVDDTVFVIQDDSTVVMRDVTTGLSDEDYIEIISGLTLGETVVTTGQHLVSDGSLVRVISSEYTSDHAVDDETDGE